MNNMELKPKDREKLNHLVSELFKMALSAYVDCFIYLESHLRKNNSFIFIYSRSAIQERLIIAVKKLIEPAKSDKLTMFSIGKIIEKPDFCDSLQDKKGIKYIYTDRLKEIFNSVHAKRLKDMRDAFCHNFCDEKNGIRGYCKDFMIVLQECLNILSDVKEQILDQPETRFQQVKDLALKISKDYWNCVISGAKKSKITDKDLKMLSSFIGNML